MIRLSIAIATQLVILCMVYVQGYNDGVRKCIDRVDALLGTKARSKQ